MLMPKNTKYKKQQRSRLRGKAMKAFSLNFGSYGIYAKESGFISNRQIEAARIVINRSLKKGGKIYLRIFPDYPFTKKPTETRMGKGKGNVESWLAKIKQGRILFEISGTDSREIAQKALKLAGSKLSLKTGFIEKGNLI